jgi:hypothetical protein
MSFYVLETTVSVAELGATHSQEDSTNRTKLERLMNRLFARVY